MQRTISRPEDEPHDGQSSQSQLPDEASRLRELQADIRDQDELEKDISQQALTLFSFAPVQLRLD